MLQERSLGSVKILSVNIDRLRTSLKDAAVCLRKGDRAVEQILLFGSFARGDYTPLSDIDLMIIVKHTAEPFPTRRDRYIGYFKLPFDLNILVYTVEEIEQMKARQNDFLATVLKESVVL